MVTLPAGVKLARINDFFSPDIFRYIYFGLTIGVKLLAFLLAAALWRELYKRSKNNDNGFVHESASLPTSESIVTHSAAS